MEPSHAASTAPALQLPVLVFGRVEVRRLRRELEALEDFMRQSAIRTPGSQPSLPRASRLLETLAGDNNLNMLQPEDRATVRQFLSDVEQAAPSVHMSFASDPSANFTAKLVTWLRNNIHPYVLLEVGLQPTLAAGCVLRSPNKLFDMSLRQRFADQQKELVQSLDAVSGGGPATDTTETVPVEVTAAGPTQAASASVAPVAATAQPTPVGEPAA